MPIREADRRKQELQQYQDQLAHLDRVLRDQDWIERLIENEDFKKYLARVDEAQAKNNESLQQVIKALSLPCKTRDERAALNEHLLVVQATIEAVRTVADWPKEQEARLVEARKTMPDIKARIKELEGK